MFVFLLTYDIVCCIKYDASCVFMISRLSSRRGEMMCFVIERAWTETGQSIRGLHRPARLDFEKSEPDDDN